MSAPPTESRTDAPPAALLWGGAGMVAAMVHLMLVQQGLAAMGNARAAAPPELPLIEVMAVASTVQGQDQPVENARPVTSEALRPNSAADRLAAASPSAERAQTAQTAAAVAARPVAPSAAAAPRLAAAEPATPAAPAQSDAAERLAALVSPASPAAPVAPTVEPAARLAPSAGAASVARPAAPAPRQPGLAPVLTSPESVASVAARPAGAASAAPASSAPPSAPRATPVARAAPAATVAQGAARVAAVAPPPPLSTPAQPSAVPPAQASSATAPAQPAPSTLAPTAVAPAPAAIAPSAPAPALAPVPSLPPPAAAEEQQGIAAPLPETAPEAPANENTYDVVLDHLAEMAQPDCFAALPSLSDEGRFQLEVFAKDAADLSEFRNRLEGYVGQRMPNTTMKPISADQCAVMGFLTEGPSYPRFKLFFDIPRRVIQSGEALEGRIGNTSGGFITFLVIDDEGTVQDLATFLQFVPGGARFSIPLSLTAGPVETQQLLLVMSTPARLRTVELHNGAKAESFFPLLAAELRERGQTEDVAIVAFSVR